MKMLHKIKFFYNLFIITFISAFFIVPLMFFFRKKVHFIIHIANLIIKFLIFYKIKTYGKKDNSANIFMINHKSAMDILSLEAVQQQNFKWIAKKEIFNFFWIGNLMKYGKMIPVERESKLSLLKLIRDIKVRLENDKNLQIAIFPEGTKNKSHNKLRPFKLGSKIIAEKFNLKIQPIVIINSKSVMDEHKQEAKILDNIIYIHYLESFYPDKDNKNWMEDMREMMQNKIDIEYLNINKKVD